MMLYLLAALPVLLLAGLVGAFGGKSDDDDDTPPQSDDPTSGDDTRRLGAGDDLFDALGGDDSIRGGEGNDRLLGNDGDDRLDGNAGNDALRGGRDDDVLSGGAGDDSLFEGPGLGLLFGGDGDDAISARDTGRDPFDELFGGAGNDRLYADDGDTVTGDAGEDAFWIDIADTTRDTPTIITDFDPAQDVLRIEGPGGTGVPVSYAQTSGGVMVVVAQTSAIVLQGLDLDQAAAINGRITYNGQPLQNFFGSDSDDTFVSTRGTAEVQTFGGNDTITLTRGADTDVLAGEGDDRLTVIEGRFDQDHRVLMQDGNDRVRVVNGDGFFDLGAGDDRFANNPQAGESVGNSVTVNGGPGNDTIVNYSPNSSTGFGVLFGGDGDDVIEFGYGENVSGGEGTDSFIVHGGVSVPEISDFDPTTEQLTIVPDPGEAIGTGDITFATEPDSTTIVLIRGEATVRLSGLFDPDLLAASIVIRGAAPPA